MICAMVVDHSRSLRSLLVAALERTGQVRVVAHCATLDEALESLDYVEPELLILSDNLPGSNGADVVRGVRQRVRGARSILLLDGETDWHSRFTGCARPNQVVSKAQGLAELLAAVLDGETGLVAPLNVGGAVVVDPDAESRAVVRQACEQLGLPVQEAQNAHEAARLLECAPPALMFIERALPDGDSLTWLGRCYTHQPMPQTILVGGRADQASVMAAARLGVQGWLRKPLTVDSVVRSLTHLGPEMTSPAVA